LFDEIEKLEDLGGSNIDREVAAPRATGSTGERADIRGRGDSGIMALLRASKRAKHSQVSDLLTRQRVFPLEYVADKGNIKGKFHGRHLNPNPAGWPSAIYFCP
jgi:hypothetical protein